MNQPTFNVKLREIIDPHTASIDLTKLFQLSEERRRQPVLRPQQLATPSGRARLFENAERKKPALAPFFPRVQSALSGGTFRQLAPALESLFSARTASPKLPQPRKYSLGKTKGTASRLAAFAELEDAGKQTVTLPFFLGRHITAGALKTLSGHPDEVIFHQQGSKWAIVSDDHVIDLDDRTQVYRVGPVQVYS
jgi:hypothetical protein